MKERSIIDLETVANEIVEVLSRNKITYCNMDYVFERTKEIAHSNTINQPLKFSTNDKPS